LPSRQLSGSYKPQVYLFDFTDRSFENDRENEIAEIFATGQGLAIVSPDSFFTQSRWDAFLKAKTNNDSIENRIKSMELLVV
jgi:hypothetical protein